jgi:hypothetical protein
MKSIVVYKLQFRYHGARPIREELIWFSKEKKTDSNENEEDMV